MSGVSQLVLYTCCQLNEITDNNCMTNMKTKEMTHNFLTVLTVTTNAMSTLIRLRPADSKEILILFLMTKTKDVLLFFRKK